MTAHRRQTRWRAGGLLALLALAMAACRPATGGASAPNVPPAEAYGEASDFAGEWLGQSDGSSGQMTISRLGERRYYGRFESEDSTLRYVANMTQETARVGESEVPANVVRFEWQDGRGGVGSGWLMINKEGSALTGEIIYGVAPTGGALAYVRVEKEPPSALASATTGADEVRATGP